MAIQIPYPKDPEAGPANSIAPPASNSNGSGLANGNGDGSGNSNDNDKENGSNAHPKANLEDHPPIAGLNDGGPAVHPGKLTQAVEFDYEVVQGHFIQNGPQPKHLSFDQILERHFGLLDSSPERWNNLRLRLDQLQADAPDGVIYKVLFLGRHGQGWHNHAVTVHGVEAWEAKWTFLRTDGVLTWGPDPALTPLGESQAANVLAAWRKEAECGAPVGRGREGEMRWFVSPLRRACQTMYGSFGEFIPGGATGQDARVGSEEYGKANRPEAWEDWREITGSHTCDERSDKTTIQARFPHLAIEPEMEQDDIYWKADDRETNHSMQIRGRRALDRVFGEGGAKERFISITSHSEFFRNLLAVLDHQPYPLSTGEMIPVVVKATRVGVGRADEQKVEVAAANGNGNGSGTGNGHANGNSNGHGHQTWNGSLNGNENGHASGNGH